MKQKDNAATDIAAQERNETSAGSGSVSLHHHSTTPFFNQLVAQAVTIAHRPNNTAKRRRLIHLARFLQRWTLN